jgi:hypothetical protein
MMNNKLFKDKHIIQFSNLDFNDNKKNKKKKNSSIKACFSSNK